MLPEVFLLTELLLNSSLTANTWKISSVSLDWRMTESLSFICFLLFPLSFNYLYIKPFLHTCTGRWPIHYEMSHIYVMWPVLVHWTGTFNLSLCHALFLTQLCWLFQKCFQKSDYCFSDIVVVTNNAIICNILLNSIHFVGNGDGQRKQQLQWSHAMCTYLSQQKRHALTPKH